MYMYILMSILVSDKLVKFMKKRAKSRPWIYGLQEIFTTLTFGNFTTHVHKCDDKKIRIISLSQIQLVFPAHIYIYSL